MSTQTETPGGAAAEEPTEKKLSEEEFVRWIRSTPRSPDRDVVLTTPLTTPHARLKRIQRRYFEEVAKKFERQRMIELEWVAAIDNWCVLLVGALSHPDSQTLTRVVVRCARLLACSRARLLACSRALACTSALTNARWHAHRGSLLPVPGRLLPRLGGATARPRA